MSELSIEQKIELMNLASKVGIELGKSSASIEQVIANYQKIIKEITSAAA